ncbi:MAG: energy-coupling factor transporter transmembrane protein EcfT [Atopobiaceae bacterium]|jgi:energy-coupling factor transporter transmembrane protein EcfT|nr:energy-coupling factor transporter transmembrane protein EcfT [Atopobiaceae bacterium]
MALNMTFGHYFPASSPVHRLDGRAKSACALVCMVATCFVSRPGQLALVTAFVLAVLALSRVPVSKVLSSMGPLFALFALTGLFNLFWVHTGDVVFSLGPVSVWSGGAWAALLYATRLALVVCLGVLLTLTTTPTRLTDAFDALLSPLSLVGAPTHEWSMVLSLALRFVPTLADDTSAVMDAQRSRGSSLAEGTPLRRAQAFAGVLVPLLAMSLRHAEGLSRALDARSYEGGAARTRWHEQRLSWPEAVAAAAVALLVAGLVALGMR